MNLFWQDPKDPYQPRQLVPFSHEAATEALVFGEGRDDISYSPVTHRLSRATSNRPPKWRQVEF